MKKKIWLISGIAGVVLLGGAMGAAAIDNPETKTNAGEKLIPIEEAEEITLKEVNGTVESIELEREHGRLVYDVDVNSKDNHDDIEVDVDAKTGAVVKVDDDQNDGSQKSVTQSTQQSQNIITKEEAISIATADIPGKAVKVDFDGDDGDYEIEIRDGRVEAEYEIDAYTGQILEKDIEDDDDDDDNDD